MDFFGENIETGKIEKNKAYFRITMAAMIIRAATVGWVTYIWNQNRID